jgi:esterase/lipase superfamily enzyme
MYREHFHWRSPNLGHEMGLVVYGHFGSPMLMFPTSLGDEWEHEGQSMIRTLSPFLEAGRLKIVTLRSVTQEGLFNTQAHPFHRSWVLRCYDAYIRQEVVPFIHHHCQGFVPITTLGASLGAYHAANTIFKYPDVVKRCFALSGVYDMRSSMNGMYDDNFYFNNPVDYLPNLGDQWALSHLASCDIHIVTGNGPFENSGPSYQLAEILRRKGIPHSLDDWGEKGGHDWPYWHHQIWTYCSQLY